MLKLSKTERSWTALAVIAWLVVLAGLILIPMSRPASANQQALVAPTNSLAATLQNAHPTSGAVVAQLVDPALVYDAETYAGYITLCANEPEELRDAKLAAFQFEEEPDLSGQAAYVVLLPPDEETPVGIDQVDTSKIDICSFPQTEAYPLNSPMPFYFQGGRWSLGVRS